MVHANRGNSTRVNPRFSTNAGILEVDTPLFCRGMQGGGKGMAGRFSEASICIPRGQRRVRSRRLGIGGVGVPELHTAAGVL